MVWVLVPHAHGAKNPEISYDAGSRVLTVTHGDGTDRIDLSKGIEVEVNGKRTALLKQGK